MKTTTATKTVFVILDSAGWVYPVAGTEFSTFEGAEKFARDAMSRSKLPEYEIVEVAA